MVKKKRKLFIRVLLVCAVSISSLFFYIEENRRLEEIPTFAQRGIPKGLESSVKIGLIGDSWIAGEKIDQSIQEAMSLCGIKADITSSGHPGADTRKIFLNLFSKGPQQYSSNEIIMDEDVDYLVVIAGVNDTVSHKGKEYYAHHMLQIIRVAISRGIYPVIVEVPEYGIIETPENSFLLHIKHVVYRILFDGNKQNVIKDYRESLRNLIPSTIIEKMTLVSFDSFIKDYSANKHLYANPSHLNTEGWHKLGVFLADEITKIHKQRINSF